jgi:anti-sigma regulatory factor (Ser/Thr protein kinase)
VTQGRGGEHGARFGTDRRSTVTKPLRRSLPAVPASVPVLLAVSEAVTNAVMHAYLDADEPGEVRVVTCLRGATVYVTVSDDGVGMMPRLDSPGLGVGLPFIADTADTLDIDSTEGGGTELRMSFRLAGGQLPAP